jgi:hypothetical protein
MFLVGKCPVGSKSGMTLMRTTTIETFSHIAVALSQLQIVLRETLISQPAIETHPKANSSTMCISSAVDMIDGKELWLSFATTCTFIAISIKNLPSKLISYLSIVSFLLLTMLLCILPMIGEAMIAKMSWLTWSCSATTANAFWRLSTPVLTVFCCIVFSQLFLIIEGFPQRCSILLTNQVGIALKRLLILNMTAFSTATAKTVRRAFIGAKVLRRSGFELLALVAAFLWGIILGYNILHGRTSNVLSRSGVFVAFQTTPNLPHHYTITPLYKQLHTTLATGDK